MAGRFGGSLFFQKQFEWIFHLTPPSVFPARRGVFVFAATSYWVDTYFRLASFLFEASIQRMATMEMIVITRLNAEARGQLRTFCT